MLGAIVSVHELFEIAMFNQGLDFILELAVVLGVVADVVVEVALHLGIPFSRIRVHPLGSSEKLFVLDLYQDCP